ncbi:MAG: hypothetical protein ABIO70_08065 [Pseudomonadota bacterium]
MPRLLSHPAAGKGRAVDMRTEPDEAVTRSAGLPCSPRPRLPGEILLDQRLVEHAVHDLNELYSRRNLETGASEISV